MSRVAIFVDAGYLFAQGSAALSGGAKHPRSLCKLNETAAVAKLTAVANAKATDRQLLRIYWYDGAIHYTGPTAEQTALAHLDNVKLRLGFVNGRGQQKGVDSLIVTDLIELARNQAICDAVLLSGDEDVRIGVQIAQNFGVRVHLIGIAPSRGSQSKQLLQEADTTTEWDRATIETFLSVVRPAPPLSPPATEQEATVPAQSAEQSQDGTVHENAVLEKVVVELIATLTVTDITRLNAEFATSQSVPPEFDGKLLAMGRAALSRDLFQLEKRKMRQSFRGAVRDKDR